MKLLNKLLRSWDHFFFKPMPTEGMALFRLIWCTLLGFHFLLEYSNIHDFYGPHAVISFQTLANEANFELNILKLFQQNYFGVHSLFFIYALSLITSFLGLFTRGSLIVVFICLTSLHQRNLWILEDADVLMRVITFFLILSPCGHSLSLDSLIGRTHTSFHRPKHWPIWSLRLIQIQISLLYLSSLVVKLSGETWLSGTAVYYITRLDHLAFSSVPWILDNKITLAFLSWITLGIDFLLGAMIWKEKWRKQVILIGLAFHLSILYVTGISFGSVIMMILLLSFYSPVELQRFIQKIQSTLIIGLRESSLSTNIKVKLIKSIRGSYE